MELPTLMSSRAASPARTSASRDAASDFPVSVPVSLRRSPVWLANFDHSSFCWRTSQSCLVEGLETFSERWPRSGMMRNGIAYQRPSLARPISEIARGFLPTPTKGGGGQTMPPGTTPTGIKPAVQKRQVSLDQYQHGKAAWREKSGK